MSHCGVGPGASRHPDWLCTPVAAQSRSRRMPPGRSCRMPPESSEPFASQLSFGRVPNGCSCVQIPPRLIYSPCGIYCKFRSPGPIADSQRGVVLDKMKNGGVPCQGAAGTMPLRHPRSAPDSRAHLQLALPRVWVDAVQPHHRPILNDRALLCPMVGPSMSPVMRSSPVRISLQLALELCILLPQPQPLRPAVTSRGVKHQPPVLSRNRRANRSHPITA
jgi:hypothetical protein